MVGFLEQPLSRIPGKVLVVWDDLPIHRSRVVKDFLAAGAAARLWLERLTAYAPELNPTEGIWRYLKRVELCNPICHSLDHLHRELIAGVERLRQKPDVIQGCIRHPGCYFMNL